MGKFYEDVFIFKVLLVGDATVGKSCLLEKYVNNNFLWKSLSTIGVDFQTIAMKYMDQKIKLQIWDTAGQERFRTITGSYYREADCVILCYDITNRESFRNLDTWIKEVKEKSPDNVIIYLVGTKIDQAEIREVDEETALKYTKEKDIVYCETSSRDFSKERLNEIIFKPIIKDLYERDKNLIDEGPPIIEDRKLPTINKENCCRIS